MSWFKAWVSVALLLSFVGFVFARTADTGGTDGPASTVVATATASPADTLTGTAVSPTGSGGGRH